MSAVPFDPVQRNATADTLHEINPDLLRVAETYPVLVSRFLQERHANGDYSTAAMRQFHPDLRELDNKIGYTAETTAEAHHYRTPTVVQTYDNRVALILTHRCLVYCRFCFRKDFVGLPTSQVGLAEIETGLNYIAANESIIDVLVTGGDPLALSNAKLFPILRRLAAVRHVGTIRIHSRAVSVAPGRIDDELLRFLGESGKYCYYAHMNHPDDLLHPDVLQAVNRLRLAGIPVFNQCVLLRGVNDDIATIRKLMLACYAAKVFPYNLYLLDRVAGVAHFEVDQVTVKAIFDSLEDLPGPAQPVFVLVDRHNRKQRAIPSGDFDLFSFLRHGS